MIEIKNIEYYLGLIEEPNRRRCLNMFEVYKDKFFEAPGSKVKHQAWVGGYIHHLEQIMAIAEFKYEPYNQLHKLDFSLSDAILVLFLHDLEKPFKYVDGINFANDKEKLDFILKQVSIFKISLNEKHLNALECIHGGDKDYKPDQRTKLPLAEFCHTCDADSAGVFHEFKHREL